MEVDDDDSPLILQDVNSSVGGAGVKIKLRGSGREVLLPTSCGLLRTIQGLVENPYVVRVGQVLEVLHLSYIDYLIDFPVEESSFDVKLPYDPV